MTVCRGLSLGALLAMAALLGCDSASSPPREGSASPSAPAGSAEANGAGRQPGEDRAKERREKLSREIDEDSERIRELERQNRRMQQGKPPTPEESR